MSVFGVWRDAPATSGSWLSVDLTAKPEGQVGNLGSDIGSPSPPVEIDDVTDLQIPEISHIDGRLQPDCLEAWSAGYHSTIRR